MKNKIKISQESFRYMGSNSLYSMLKCLYFYHGFRFTLFNAEILSK